MKRLFVQGVTTLLGFFLYSFLEMVERTRGLQALIPQSGKVLLLSFLAPFLLNKTPSVTFMKSHLNFPYYIQ